MECRLFYASSIRYFMQIAYFLAFDRMTMTTPARWPLFFGGALTATAILLAALASHALPDIMMDPVRSHRFTTALQMHLANAPGLLLIGVALLIRTDNRWWQAAAALLLLGIVLFSGNLYLLAFTQSTPAAWLTPLGGLCMIAAWLIFAIGALTMRRKD